LFAVKKFKKKLFLPICTVPGYLETEVFGRISGRKKQRQDEAQSTVYWIFIITSLGTVTRYVCNAFLALLSGRLSHSGKNVG
jgi:hypothetical protein